MRLMAFMLCSALLRSKYTSHINLSPLSRKICCWGSRFLFESIRSQNWVAITSESSSRPSAMYRSIWSSVWDGSCMPNMGTGGVRTPPAMMPLLGRARSSWSPFRYVQHRRPTMDEPCVLALTGTPGVGKTTVASWLQAQGWGLLSVADLADSHGCLDEVDPKDGAAPIDIQALDEAWEPPRLGRWVVDGHLSHFLNVDAIVV